MKGRIHIWPLGGTVGGVVGETEGEGKLEAISSGTFFFFLRVCFKEKKKGRRRKEEKKEILPVAAILPLLPQRDGVERKASGSPLSPLLRAQ